MRVAIVVPVFNDWASLAVLMQRFGDIARTSEHTFEVVVVDDGSTQSPPDATPPSQPGVEYQVLVLTRNVGHQAAIAIGLCYIIDRLETDAIVVMDGDGEDRPEDVHRLLAVYSVFKWGGLKPVWWWG